MNNKYYVYEWYNAQTQEIFYVGKGIRNRYCQISGRNQFFMDYYHTHVCESRIIFDNLSEKEAYEKEIEIIKYYRENSNFRLTNISDGGEGHPFLRGNLNPKFGKGGEIRGINNPFYGKKHSARVKKILSEKASLRKGEKNPFFNKHHSEETKYILSKKAKERLKNKESNPMFGKTHSEEARKKIGESKVGKSLSQEHKDKISETLRKRYKLSPHFNLGRKHSTETKLKLSEIRKGKNNPNWNNGEKILGEKNPMFGKTHSEETRKKMSERAKNREFKKICYSCGSEFIAHAHNAKKCPKCRPKRNKK